MVLRLNDYPEDGTRTSVSDEVPNRIWHRVLPAFSKRQRLANVPTCATCDMENHEMNNNGSWLAALTLLALAAAMPVAADDWITFTKLDRMTGKEEVVGVYALTSPEEPRPSIFQNAEGQLLIACEDAHTIFTLADPDDHKNKMITKFMPHGLEDWIEIRARFDDDPVQQLTAMRGERSWLGFDMDPYMVTMAESRRLLLEVPSVAGDLYFDFGLTGLHEAYRETCAAVSGRAAASDLGAYSMSPEDLPQLLAMLRAGADPDEADERTGWTPILVASKNLNVAGVFALIDAGANVNAADPETGVTPLHLAAANAGLVYGAGALVSKLISAGANVNAKDGQCLTPLNYAVIGNPKFSAGIARMLEFAGGHLGQEC